MSSPTTDPAAAAALAAFLKEATYFVKTEQIFFCSMYAVCVWDWLISVKREWLLIWKSKWSLVKVLYLLCRYWVLLDIPFVLWLYVENHSWEACRKLYRSPVALAMWNQLWAEAVLLIRTYAFWGNQTVVLVPLVVAWCSVMTYQLYVVIAQLGQLPFLDPSSGGPCFPTVSYQGSPHSMAFFLVPLLFDSLVTGLTLWKAFKIRTQSGGSRSQLLKTFVSEGIWYFLLISAANLANAVFYWQPDAVKSALLVPLSIMFPDVIICRMVLGLLERGTRGTSNHRATYVHSSRRINLGAVGPTSISQKVKNTGVVTDMGFNHELATFERDVGTLQYEGDPERGPNLGDMKVNIETHRYYEGSDGDGEVDVKAP